MTSPFSVFAWTISAAMFATVLVTEPKPLAIYYGIPGLVNGAAGDLARATSTFAEYDAVVFGDGLEFDDVVPSRQPAGAGPVEYQRTKEIIARLSRSPRRTAVFGYIDLGRTQKLTLGDIRSRIGRWKGMGAAGIFFDEAGADFGVDRTRQNAAIATAHAEGMHAVLNAFNPDDVFRIGPDGVKPRIGAGDAYLLESFAVRLGRVEDGRAWRDRVDRAIAGAAATGAAIWATTTTDGEYEQALMDYAWRSAVRAGVDAFAWGEPSFGSADSRLPFRPRPR
jgi:hypothetical protein